MYPIIETYKSMVESDTMRKVAEKADRKEVDYAFLLRLLCVLLAAGVFIKPLAILFLVYPVLELMLTHWPQRHSPTLPFPKMQVSNITGEDHAKDDDPTTSLAA